MFSRTSRSAVMSATLAIVAAGVGSASAGELVQNGDFNAPGAAAAVLLGQGDTFITGWTNFDQYTGYIPQGQTPDQNWSGFLTGSAGPGYGVNNGLVTPPSGNATVVVDGTNGFGPGGGYGYIEQDVAGLVAGQTYTLSFYQGGTQEYTVTGDQNEYFQVNLGDQSFNSPSMFVPSQGFSPWQKVTTKFTWDGVGNALQFVSVGSGDPAFALLADVSLASSAPEPTTWAMLLVGVAGLGGLARSRRKTTAVA